MRARQIVRSKNSLHTVTHSHDRRRSRIKDRSASAKGKGENPSEAARGSGFSADSRNERRGCTGQRVRDDRPRRRAIEMKWLRQRGRPRGSHNSPSNDERETDEQFNNENFASRP